MPYLLSECQLDFWTQNSFVKVITFIQMNDRFIQIDLVVQVPNMLSYYERAPIDVSRWVDEVAAWEKGIYYIDEHYLESLIFIIIYQFNYDIVTINSIPAENKWLLHWELVEDGGTATRTLCRAENFVNYHENLHELCK